MGKRENTPEGYPDSRGPRHRVEAETEFNRIVSFSDGVFAIAMTLLVLTIEVPHSIPPGKTLTGQLLNQGGDLFGYVLSFAVIGILWLSHHRFFGALEKFDARLMAINLAYLGAVALIPFTTAVVGDHGDETAGVVLYAINLMIVSVTGAAMGFYAARMGLLKPGVVGGHSGTARIAIVFAASIPVAFGNPTVAVLMWLLTFVAASQRLPLWPRRSS